ncbi:serine/threonine-protein kinase [archaeon]|nr:MAG: serine/threonine-protein kinase [archaeon]
MDTVENMIQGFQKFWGFGGADRTKVGDATVMHRSMLLASQFNQSNIERKRFHISREIGCGKFSSVYLACDLHSNEDVAIKMLSKNTLEKYLSKKLPSVYSDAEKHIMMDGHKNIVQLYESYYDEQENFCMVMEYCPGGNLMQYIQEQGRLPEHIARNFLWQVAHGLRHMHKRGFIHRDIKAANILLSEKSSRARVKLADFDLCRLLSGNELNMTTCGSPQYMAPEVFNSVGFKAYCYKADMWSMGVLLHVMLVGRVPYTGQSVYDLYCNVVNTALPWQPPEGVSEAAWAIVLKV